MTICGTHTHTGKRCNRKTTNGACWQHGGNNRSMRPSPSVSATLFSVGTKKKGNDRNTWEVHENKSGIKRWKIVSTKDKGRKNSKIYREKQNSKLVKQCNADIIKKIKNLMEKIISNKMKLKQLEPFNLRGVEKEMTVAIMQRLVDDVTTGSDERMIIDDLEDEKLQDFLSGEIAVHVANDKKNMFLEALGAPGENNGGFGIYYDSVSNRGYIIYENMDDNLHPSCPSLKSIVKKFMQWKEKHREHGSAMFYVNYEMDDDY